MSHAPPDRKDPEGRPGRRSALLHFVAKGPFAVAAASLQGAVNYFIVVYLTYGEGLAEAGAYRTLFSYYGLLGLASMFETNKVFIRSIVAEDAHATTALFANRLLFSGSAFVVIAVAYFVAAAAGIDGPSGDLVWIAAVSAIVYPLDSYISLLQARGRFYALFATEFLKYGSALAAFLLALHLGADIGEAILAQLGAMAVCHAIFFAATVRKLIDFGMIRHRFVALVRSQPAAQARTYSLANIFPSSLEHVDKLLVGWVFGLEFLGIYTLAFSTGRFVYNTMKPALYIYYRRFVDRMPSWKLLRLVSLLFTFAGLAMAALFLAALEYFPQQLGPFRSGASATVILFASYGVGILHAIYVQAFSLNKDSVAGQALHASALATLASLLFLGAALVSEPQVALVLLALQYPVRDGLSTLLLARYRARSGS
jgi:hypothetical protein